MVLLDWIYLFLLILAVLASLVSDYYFISRYRKRIEFLEQQIMSLVSTPKR